MRRTMRASVDGDRPQEKAARLLPAAWEGDKLHDNTCLPSTSQHTPHFLSFPFPGGREGGQLPPPFWVTRETGAWAWGGARNLGVLPPSLQLRLCL